MHLALFAFLVVDSLSYSAASFMLSYACRADAAGHLLSAMLSGICVIVALVRQHESNFENSAPHPDLGGAGICLLLICCGLCCQHVASHSGTLKSGRTSGKCLSCYPAHRPWESPFADDGDIMALSGAADYRIPGLFMLKEILSQPFTKPQSCRRRRLIPVRSEKDFLMEDLLHQRCFNHMLREAVARCPECGATFAANA